MRTTTGQRCFTLIELLIVVAIIAILAAIAVPNFLEAQTRSKVTRVKADLRTLVTAVEAYAVDWNRPPADYCVDPITRPGITGFASAEGFAPPRITTPIAYLSNATLTDAFTNKEAVAALGGQDKSIYFNLFYQSTYHSREAASGARVIREYATQVPAVSYQSIKQVVGWDNDIWYTRYGSYKMGSVGPDRDYEGGSSIDFQYDPTNGALSTGDIYRTQLAAENVFRQ